MYVLPTHRMPQCRPAGRSDQPSETATGLGGNSPIPGPDFPPMISTSVDSGRPSWALPPSRNCCGLPRLPERATAFRRPIHLHNLMEVGLVQVVDGEIVVGQLIPPLPVSLVRRLSPALRYAHERWQAPFSAHRYLRRVLQHARPRATNSPTTNPTATRKSGVPPTTNMVTSPANRPPTQALAS